MEAFDVIGLLLPALEKVGDRIIGYDDQIRKKFNRALEKALSSNDELYIQKAEIHMPELIGLILLVMDEPSSINTILLPNYISRDEFRSFHAETEKDKDLCQVLKDEWNQYKAKDTNNQVKTILDMIVRLNDEKKEDRIIWRNLQTAVGQLGERFDALQDEKNGKNAANAPSLGDCLLKKLKQKRDNHPSFKLMDIEDDLFPDGMITFEFETEALDSDNQLKSVKDIVAESWNKQDRNHLMIEGKGGIGKTVSLLSLPDKLAPHYVPAVYIPLHELKGETNTIEKYIKSQILDYNDNEVRFGQLMDSVGKPWNKGPRLLMLLDGFNEISNERRADISLDIEHWSEYPGVQIITSSRYDIRQYVALSSSFSKIELQPLKEEKVKAYLKKTGFDVPESPTVINLITTPLLLTLYIRTEKLRINRKSPLADFRETKNAGLLIWNYLQSELWRYRTQKEEAKSCVLAMEFIAPYIAWTMQQHTDFVLNEDDFLDRLDEAYELLKVNFGNTMKLPKHIKTTLKQTSGQLPEYPFVRDLLQEQLSLFNRQERKDANNNLLVEYRLMHQQFRDALAAMHLINSIYLNGDSRPMEWNSTVDHYVMQFVAYLIDEEEANRLWEQNRTSPQLENATRNQLELQRQIHNGDFATMNFSELDLSNISLFPYRVNNTILKLPTDVDKMIKTVLSEKTFSAEGHSGSVNTVAITQDGKRIVSGSRDKTIRIWNLENGAPIGNIIKGHEDEVNTIALSPDGRQIVSGSVDKTIRIWDLETGNPIMNPIKGHEGGVNAIAITPDGKYIVSGSVDKTIRIWDLKTGDFIGNPLEGHGNWVTAVAVTPDSKYIVSGSSDNTIRIWDLKTRTQIGKPIKGHKNWIKTLAITPDGRRVVSGSFDNTILIWDLKKRCPIHNPIEGHRSVVKAIAITPDGKHIISGSNDNTIRIWNIETGLPIGSPIEGHEREIKAIAVTPDGKRFVSGSNDNTLYIWDLGTRKPIGNPIGGHKSAVYSVAVTPDGKHIISGSGDKTIRLWDLETMTSVKHPINAHDAAIYTIAVTPDGKQIISGSWDRSIRIWNAEDQKLIGVLKGHEGAVNAIAITPDGKRIVSGSSDKTIRIWDLNSKALLNTIKGHQGSVYTIAMALSGKHFISGSEDTTICIWDFSDTPKPHGNPIKEHIRPVTAIDLTKDGKYLISGSKDKTICIWDLETNFQKKKSFKAHKFAVTAITVSPNGEFIASGSSDNTVRIWNLETGKLIKTIEGIKGSIYATAMTPDGKHVISGAYNGTICITNIKTFEVKTIHIHPLSFIDLDFSKAIISTPELKETLRQNGAIV